MKPKAKAMPHQMPVSPQDLGDADVDESWEPVKEEEEKNTVYADLAPLQTRILNWRVHFRK